MGTSPGASQVFPGFKPANAVDKEEAVVQFMQT
jgi:hypothetical protein